MKSLECGGRAAGVAIVAAIGLSSRFANADIVCGSTSAGWNVPNGATVYEVAPGPVGNLLHSLGEYRSHSMLSRGPDGWVTHSTSIIPPHSDDCHNPINKGFMAASTPGLSTIDQGAAYTFLYINNGAPSFIAYQRATTILSTLGNVSTGPLVGNLFLGSPAPFYTMSWAPLGSGSNTVWGTAFGPTTGPQQPIYYGWAQYMNIGTTAQGFPPAQRAGQGDGVVCSTSLAMWQHDAMYNMFQYTGDIKPRQYSQHDTSVAANQLWSDVYNYCNGTTNVFHGGTFLDSFLAGVACLGISVCANAANQMVNAFADDGFVNDTAAEWQNIVAHNGAVSISPDDVACWNSNGTGAPCFGSGSSFWGFDEDNNLQWNSGGNSYGCWQQ